MRVDRWFVIAALSLTLIAASPPTGHAQLPEDPGTSVVYGQDSGASETERWWGALGAMLCGAEMWLIRANPAIGMQPAALAAGIAGCALAFLDVVTT